LKRDRTLPGPEMGHSPGCRQLSEGEVFPNC